MTVPRLAIPLLLGQVYTVFLFGQSKPSEPAEMSYDERPTVVSPDGKWQLTVWGRKDEGPWLTLESRYVKIRLQKMVD